MRYDLCSPRPKKDGGTFWHKIGAMFPDDKGGFSIILDSGPFADKEGRVIVKAFAPKDNQQTGQGSSQQGGYGGQGGYSAPPSGGAPGVDDEIPFAAEWRI